MRDDLVGIKTDIVEEISKKIDSEMAVVRAQQAADRAFMETKFAQLLEKVLPSLPAEGAEK